MNNKKIFKANQKSPTSTISENIWEKKTALLPENKWQV